MSIPYPNGGTPPTSFDPVHAVSEHVHPSSFAFTGRDIALALAVAGVCIVVGLVMVAIARWRIK